MHRLRNRRLIRRRPNTAQRGEAGLLVVILVLALTMVLIVLPLDRFLALLRLTTEASRTRMMSVTTESIQQQAAAYLEQLLLPRIGAHFQTAVENDPAFRAELEAGLDPLFDLEYRSTFFRRAFLVPHLNVWLQMEPPTADPRLNTVRAYLESLGGAAVLDVAYFAAEETSGGVDYILQCQVSALSREGDKQLGGKEVRIASFPCRFRLQHVAPNEPQTNLYLPGVVLYPEYQSQPIRRP